MFFAVNYKMLLVETHELSNKIVCFGHVSGYFFLGCFNHFIL